jgi:hypothetical protein
MALKDTVACMKELLEDLSRDLDKATGGNKAASQRVRTGSIKLEKVAKAYRKESVASEKRGGSRAKKAAPKKAAKKAAPAKKATAKLPKRR